MDNSNKYSGRTITVVLVVSLIVLAVVICGITVYFFVDGNLSKIILISLIAVLILIGGSSILGLELQGRYYSNKPMPRDENRSAVLVNTWTFNKTASNRTTLEA